MGKRFNQAEFEDDGVTIVFSADFGAARQINELGRDLSLIFIDLENGLFPVEDIRSVLISCLESVGGQEKIEGEKESYIEYIISKHGIQECSIVARLLLSHALLGDKKKLQTLRAGEVREVIMNLIPSQSKNLLLVGLFLAATSLISTGLVCVIFKFFGNLILP